MPIELIEHFFTPDDTSIETSSEKAGFTKFVDQFNDYGSQHFDISPKSHPLFFYHMFLASVAYLQKNELTQKLLTNELYYKNDMDSRVLKLAYRRDESDNGRLVLRLLDFSNDESSDCHFTNDEIKELLLNLEVHHGKNSVDYKKVVIDQTEKNFLKESSTEKRLKEYDASVIVKAYYDPTFSSTSGRIHNYGTQNPIMFSFLSSPDSKRVLKAATDIFTDLKNIYKSLTDSFKADKLTVQGQAGFLTGIFVLNLKARNVFQLHVATKKDSIQLYMLSDIKSSQNFDSKIPVVFDITPVVDAFELLKTRNMIDLLGVRAHPALETNSKTSVYILTALFDSPTAEEHTFVVRVDNKYEGLLRKITDYYDGCPEDQCLIEEELQDMTHQLTQEMEYSMNVLNSRSKVMVDRFVMGQIMSFDMPEMNRYKYEYLGETADDVSTYALYVESNKKQIVINIMQESDPKFEELSQFKGRLVPHHHDKMIYESLVVNLIVDQKKQKTRTTAKYQVVNLEQWYKTYHRKPDRGISLKQYLSDRGVIFSGLAKSILSYNFNEVLYNKASILQEDPRFMEGIMAHLHSQYKTYFRDEREFVAFCRGAAVEKFELMASYKTYPDILALKRESKRWYSYTKKRFFSDILRATILVKVVKIDQDNEDLTANLLFSKVTEFYATVQDEVGAYREKPVAFAMAFGENKVVVKPLEYEVVAEQTAQPSSSGDVTKKLNSMCLSPKSRRKKRENMRQQCLFDWEDVDQFNEGKLRDNREIKIDEGRFLGYLAKVESENKRHQLLDFVEQQGTIRNSQLQHIVSQSKLIKRLSGLSKTSHLVMRSFMLKSIVGDLLSGDFKSFAANVGFIGGSYVMMTLSDNMKTRALKLSLASKATFRNAVKVVAPFVSRLTSAYNVYHLYKSIQAYKDGSSEALLSIVNDGTFVLVDTVEIGAEILETFGVVEGLTSIVFPIGTALAALAMLGTEIYTAYKSFKALEQINEEIHLTKSEWFVEGFRSLLGMNYHDYLPKLFQAKELNQHLVNAKSVFLNKPGIDHVIFSTERVCKSMNTNCDNSLIVLDSKYRTHWNRAKPNTINNISLSCYSENVINSNFYQQQLRKILRNYSRLSNDFPSGAPKDGTFSMQISYFCQNAIGLSRKNAKSGAAYIETGNGIDYVVGLKNHSNIVNMGDGGKFVTTGNESDSFIAHENTRGILNGSGGQDFLDVQWLSPMLERMLMIVTEQKTDILSADKKEVFLTAYNVFDVMMRYGKPDLLICHTCQTRYIESGHIVTEDNFDRIWIGFNSTCSYNMQVVLNGNVKLKNRAAKGIFFYKVPNLNVDITLKYSTNRKAKHVIMLNFELNRVESIQKVKQLVVLKTYEGLRFTFKFFNRRVSLLFSDKVEIKVKKLKMFATWMTGTASNAMKYIDDAERLKIIFTIWLTDKNETLLIGHSIEHALVNNTNAIHHTANIMRNNPNFSSHLIGGNGEHVYVVGFPLDDTSEISTSQFHNTTIYFYKDTKYWDLIDTIDIQDFTQEIENRFDMQTELTITRSNFDVILTLNANEEESGTTFRLFSIILKSAFDLEWYKKVVVVHHRPMNISYIDSNHSRSQSIRQEYHENGGVGINRNDVVIFPIDCNDLKLLPVEMIFSSNVSLIIIQESDIEQNITIKIEQSILGFDFVQHDSNLLIFAYKDPFDLDTATVVILKNFFARYFSNLHTMNLEFENLDFNLMQQMTLKGLVTLDQLVEDEEKFLLKMIHD